MGGDGGLMNKIFPKHKNEIVTYTLIEQSDRCPKSRHPAQKIFKEDATRLDYIGRFGLHSYDVILGSGALTEHVVTKDEAIRILDQLVDCLCPGGYMIFSGWAAHHFTKADLERRGLVVHNSHLPSSELETIQAYIVSKP